MVPWNGRVRFALPVSNNAPDVQTTLLPLVHGRTAAASYKCQPGCQHQEQMASLSLASRVCIETRKMLQRLLEARFGKLLTLDFPLLVGAEERHVGILPVILLLFPQS